MSGNSFIVNSKCPTKFTPKTASRPSAVRWGPGVMPIPAVSRQEQTRRDVQGERGTAGWSGRGAGAGGFLHVESVSACVRVDICSFRPEWFDLVSQYSLGNGAKYRDGGGCFFPSYVQPLQLQKQNQDKNDEFWSDEAAKKTPRTKPWLVA